MTPVNPCARGEACAAAATESAHASQIKNRNTRRCYPPGGKQKLGPPMLPRMNGHPRKDIYSHEDKRPRLEGNCFYILKYKPSTCETTQNIRERAFTSFSSFYSSILRYVQFPFLFQLRASFESYTEMKVRLGLN